LAIHRAIARIECTAATHLLLGVRTGYELATRHFQAGQVSRGILCSDGVANIGPDEVENVLAIAGAQRSQGITFTSVGVGEGSYNDSMLEQLANQGDGNYIYLDSKAAAQRAFVDEFAATLHTVARDVKIQVTFNPKRVRRYRLIGYENREIADSDFRNDAVDAGEIGSDQSATALYELELLEGGGDLGNVSIRHKAVDSDAVSEFTTRLAGDLVKPLTPETAPRFFLAAGSAEFAEILRESEFSQGNLHALEQYILRTSQALPMDRQVAELLDLVRLAQGLPRFGQ
jgi:Ca-activated chloride channel homolog